MLLTPHEDTITTMAPYIRRTLFRKWKYLIGVLGGVTILTGATVVDIAYNTIQYWTAQLPSLEPLDHLTGDSAATIIDHEGHILRTWGEQERKPINTDDIPALLATAIVSTEDRTFWTNNGIDPMGIIRAMWWNHAHPGQRPRGASTITQQLIKNTITGNQHTIQRKIDEALLSLKLTEAWPKKRILVTYMNTVYLGQRYYGVEAAAEGYFGQHVDTLTLPQAAMIAGLFKSPDNYDPIRHPMAAKARRDTVINQMMYNGFITPTDGQQAITTPLDIIPHNTQDGQGRWTSDEAIREGSRILAGSGGGQALGANGLTIKTTVIPDIQAILDQDMVQGIASVDKEHNGWHGTIGHRHTPNDTWPDACARAPQPGWHCATTFHGFTQVMGVDTAITTRVAYTAPGDVLWMNINPSTHEWTPQQIPLINGAAVLMDSHTGAILAMSGGWGYTPGGFNRATQAMRQPGSSFKPFLALAALEQGIAPNALFLDGPFIQQRSYGDAWTPKDYERTTLGMVPLHLALRDSLNIPMVRVAEQIGLDRFSAIATQSGAAPTIYPGLPSALGTNETTPARLAAGYAMIANGGHSVIPHVIESIKDYAGHDILPPPDSHTIVDPKYTYQLTTMLRDVMVHGTGASIGKGVSTRYAGKTGTSQDQRDAWFVGYTPDRVLVVWIGYDQPRNIGHGATGGHIAGPIWHTIASHIGDPNEHTPQDVPTGLRMIWWSLSNDSVCKTPGKDCVLGAFADGQDTKEHTPQPFYDPNPETTPAATMALAESHGSTDEADDDDDEGNEDNTTTDTPDIPSIRNNDAPTQPWSGHDTGIPDSSIGTTIIPTPPPQDGRETALPRP